eukprot:TRINITY_DN22664_c0_g1_i1.p1 TRINITY_DN22664_c0_g1~~TRINITY_DN22664_c0_g1_i1.p1  ORF type:complete len:562 (-),score=59.99 TRINITY_DN22664_c0_g1_i1:96-1781(-)
MAIVRPLGSSAPKYGSMGCACVYSVSVFVSWIGEGALGARRGECVAPPLLTLFSRNSTGWCCGPCGEPDISRYISKEIDMHFCGKEEGECCWETPTYDYSAWNWKCEAEAGNPVDYGPLQKEAPPCCNDCGTLHLSEYHSMSDKEYFYQSENKQNCCWMNDCTCDSAKKDVASSKPLNKLQLMNAPLRVLPCLTESGEKLSMTSCAVSKKGDGHKLSEDSFVHACNSQGVCIVAAFDGHGSGSEKASKTAAELFRTYVLENIDDLDVSFVKGVVGKVAKEFKSNTYANKGCTATGFFVNLKTAVVISFNVGDSRTLVWKTSSGEEVIRTRDHDSASDDHIVHLLCIWHEKHGQEAHQNMSPELADKITSACSQRAAAASAEAVETWQESEIDTLKKILKTSGFVYIQDETKRAEEERDCDLEFRTKKKGSPSKGIMLARSFGDNAYGERLRDTPDVIQRSLAGETHSFVVGSDGVFDTWKQSDSPHFVRDAKGVSDAIIKHINSEFQAQEIIDETSGTSKLFELTQKLVEASQKYRGSDPCFGGADDTTALVGFLKANDNR